MSICFKCGQDKKTVKHHIKYTDADDQIVDCCHSCHRQIHVRIRKQRLCPISPKEAWRLSRNSNHRRTYDAFYFYERLYPNVFLREEINVLRKGENVTISSGFKGSHGVKLYDVDVNL